MIVEQVNGTFDINNENIHNSPNKNGLLIGIGRGGNRALNHVYVYFKNKGFSFFAMDTDGSVLNDSVLPAWDLLHLNGKLSKHPILSSGVDFEIFEQTTITLIKDRMMDSIGEVVYLMVCLGDVVTNRLAIEVAKISKELGKIVVAIVSFPKQEEGSNFSKLANKAFAELRQFIDSFFVFHNNFLQKSNSNKNENLSPLELNTKHFRLPIEAIHNIINQKGEIIVDECDVKSVIKSGTFSAVGIGESKQSDRISDMFAQVLSSPYLKYLNREKCKLIVMNIESSELNKIRNDEIESLNTMLRQHFGHKANIIVGMEKNNALGEWAKLVCLFSFLEHEILSNL
jgi:cell division GTPase FtsZ